MVVSFRQKKAFESHAEDGKARPTTPNLSSTQKPDPPTPSTTQSSKSTWSISNQPDTRASSFSESHFSPGKLFQQRSTIPTRLDMGDHMGAIDESDALISGSIVDLHGRKLEAFIEDLFRLPNNRQDLRFSAGTTEQYLAWESENESILQEYKGIYELTEVKGLLVLVFQNPSTKHEVARYFLMKTYQTFHELHETTVQLGGEGVLVDRPVADTETFRRPDWGVLPEAERSGFPTWLAECAYSQGTKDLRRKAELWLTATMGKVRLVFTFNLTLKSGEAQLRPAPEGLSDSCTSENDEIVQYVIGTNIEDWEAKVIEWDSQGKLPGLLEPETSKIVFSAFRRDPNWTSETEWSSSEESDGSTKDEAKSGKRESYGKKLVHQSNDDEDSESEYSSKECPVRIGPADSTEDSMTDSNRTEIYPNHDKNIIIFDVLKSDIYRDFSHFPKEWKPEDKLPLDFSRFPERFRWCHEKARWLKATLRVKAWLRRLGLIVDSHGQISRTKKKNRSGGRNTKRKRGVSDPCSEIAKLHLLKFLFSDWTTMLPKQTKRETTEPEIEE